MRTITATVKERVVLACTAFSGVMFIVCSVLMLSNYRPLLDDSVAAQNMNMEIYKEMRASYAYVELAMAKIPEDISKSFSFKSAKATMPEVSLNAAVEELVRFGQTLVISER